MSFAQRFTRLLGSSLLVMVTALSPGGAPLAEVAEDVEAVAPPRMMLAGRVLRKDGVVPVERAELVLTNKLSGLKYTTMSGRRGRYKIGLPVGQYSLTINEKRFETYESSSVYRIAGAKKVAIDFLLLRDFDARTDDHTLRVGVEASLPEPVPERAQVVGTVVDMMHTPEQGRRIGWAEALGFIGSVLAVALAAD